MFGICGFHWQASSSGADEEKVSNASTGCLVTLDQSTPFLEDSRICSPSFMRRTFLEERC